MKLLRSFGWSTMATVSTVVCSLSFYKMFSIFLGPPGIALLSYLQNLLAVSTTIPQEGINRGVVKYLSGKPTQGIAYQSHFRSAIALHLLVYVCTIPMIFILFQQTVRLPAFLKSGYFFAAFCTGTFFQITILFLFSLLLAAQDFKKYALFSIGNSLAMLLVVLAGIQLGEEWGCLALIFSNIPALCILLVYLSKYFRGSNSAGKATITKKTLKDISQFLLLASCTMVFGRLVEFFSRLYVLSEFSVYQTGLWQSAVKISDGYSSLFSGILGAVFFPKIAAALNKGENVRHFFLKVCALVFPAIVGGLLLVFLFKSVILLVVFDHDFLPAAPFLNYQIFGDIFKLSSWLMMYLILASARIKTYLFLELISACCYILFLYLFTGKYGVMGASFAYVARNAIYFLLVFFLTLVFLFSKNFQAGETIQSS